MSENNQLLTKILLLVYSNISEHFPGIWQELHDVIGEEQLFG